MRLSRPYPSDVSSRVNEVWSIDFMHDRLLNGRVFRTFSVFDDYHHEGFGIEIDLSLSGSRIIRALNQII